MKHICDENCAYRCCYIEGHEFNDEKCDYCETESPQHERFGEDERETIEDR